VQPRMTQPAMVVPDAMQALLALGRTIEAANALPAATRSLVHLRASQINGCSFCVDMHARELLKLGERTERLMAVGAWRDSPVFTDAERAALALTDAVTRLDNGGAGVADEVWDEAARQYEQPALAALLLDIATVNLWNRLNVPTRQVPNGAAH
jgi:AhpD family alkylhydroperoxidase